MPQSLRSLRTEWSGMPRLHRVRNLPSMTVHDLRHTAASLAVQSGANVKTIQRMLGHTSAAMTLDVYSDLFDDDLDAVSAALDRAAAKAGVAALFDNKALTT